MADFRQAACAAAAPPEQAATLTHLVTVIIITGIITGESCFLRCRMTISVFNNLGGQKKGDSGVTIGGVNYGFGTHMFTGEDATKQAKFQFDFQRPTHCLLENDLADVIDNKANCTVFPISLDEDIRAVFPYVCYIVYEFLHNI